MKIGVHPASARPPQEGPAKAGAKEGIDRSAELRREPPDVRVESQLGPMADSLQLSSTETAAKTYTEQQIRSTEPTAESSLRPAKEIAPNRDDQLKEISRRIDTNYYDQPRVKSMIADKLLDRLGTNSE